MKKKIVNFIKTVVVCGSILFVSCTSQFGDTDNNTPKNKAVLSIYIENSSNNERKISSGEPADFSNSSFELTCERIDDGTTINRNFTWEDYKAGKVNTIEVTFGDWKFTLINRFSALALTSVVTQKIGPRSSAINFKFCGNAEIDVKISEKDFEGLSSSPLMSTTIISLLNNSIATVLLYDFDDYLSNKDLAENLFEKYKVRQTFANPWAQPINSYYHNKVILSNIPSGSYYLIIKMDVSYTDSGNTKTKTILLSLENRLIPQDAFPKDF